MQDRANPCRAETQALHQERGGSSVAGREGFECTRVRDERKLVREGITPHRAQSPRRDREWETEP